MHPFSVATYGQRGTSYLTERVLYGHAKGYIQFGSASETIIIIIKYNYDRENKFIYFVYIDLFFLAYTSVKQSDSFLRCKTIIFYVCVDGWGKSKVR